ncbi:MAG TPA: protein kinase [Woeseiaceae bacterium]|nr:protein kinase [Woeseiaceae bacterium]
MLASGRRLGRYEVRERLGAGGMGEVFRAHDSRLGRDVALKVLSERFKLDPHRLARFERETQVLASLNHSNIATLYGIEALGDTHALVLELVEGETLAERLACGPIPVTEALVIAAQIAAALDAAHEHGIVHRDLKPANVKLRPDGTVKLLDFGLAKIPDPVGEGSDRQAATATAIELAAGGAGVMGTPAYMSPEQARGLPVDKRSDIWAFGCVLYEMLAGARAFAGELSSDVVAKIIESEPDMGALPRGVPRIVQRLLRRCLEKDPRRRLRDMGDARLDLVDAVDNPAIDAPDDSGGSAFRRIAPGAAVAAASAMIAGTAVWLALRADTVAPVPPPVARFSIPAHMPPPELGAGLAISADGMQFAYVTADGLTVRARDRLEAVVVAERSAVQGFPFFSPDGKWLGFMGWDTLRKVPTAGGPVVTVADSRGTGNWTGEQIVFADMHGLFRISSDGGKPEELLVDPDLLEQAVSPQFLPARQAVIFTVIPTRTYITGFASTTPGARVDVLDLTTGERRTILRGGGRARYVPTGHLIYAAGGTLYAAAFDLERLELRGDAVPVVSEAGLLDFAVSDEGTLIYQAGESDWRRELVWVDRQGREEPLGAPLRPYVYPRLSPDGTRVALDVLDPLDRDILMWDLRRHALERFTRDPAGNPIVEWSPDGRHVVFGSDRFGVTNMFRQASDGSGKPERLLSSDRLQMPVCFPSENRLLFSANVSGQHRDIHTLFLDGTRHAEPLIYGPANELNADVSPDGRWIAYDSDESGVFEVYVRSYTDPYGGGRWQISSGGGRQPLWSRDGTELFYRDFSGAMMAASVKPGPTFTPGPVVMLFENAGYNGAGAQGSGRTYDLSLDGRRFLMIKAFPSTDEESSRPLVVALNWFEELKRLVPVP